MLVFFFFTMRRPPSSTLFPYTTLFRCPLSDNDLKEFVELQKTFANSKQSWSVPVPELAEGGEGWDLSVKNPNAKQEAPLREPKVIIEEIIALDKESEEILASIQGLLG